MTIWYDFTTTLRSPGRNGIANVEWSTGVALLESCPDVRGCALDGRHGMVEIDAGDLRRAVYASEHVPPTAGVDRATWRDEVRRLLRERLGPTSVPVIRALSRAYQMPKRLYVAVRRPGEVARKPDRVRLAATVAAGDVVVSLGADWEGNVAARLRELRANTGCRVVTMVHDLIPLTHPHLAFANDPTLFAAYYRSLVAASDLIVCNSEQSRRDLDEFAGAEGLALPRTGVLHLGDLEREVAVRRTEDVGDFYLWVGTVEARKNLELLYDALRIMESDGDELPTVVVAGSIGWGVGNLMHELGLQTTPASRALVVLGPVDVASLEGLYARARALLFPSYYEGWGLPVREAAIRGCPVAAGDCSAVREALVNFDGATFLSPDDPAPWAEFMRRKDHAATPLSAQPWSQTAQRLMAYVGEL